MCGIAGFVGAGDDADLRRMVEAIAHRGPDSQGCTSDPRSGVHLGHRRLSVVDHESGQQPMATPDGDLVVVFNGEIYNHGELRSELEKLGCEFNTDRSDTEVLLHAYREWGSELVERLNGMWAFAIYDWRQRRLFLSRDRLGQKPLYYAQPGPDCFVFGSELSAVARHPRVDGSLDEEALRKYFAYGSIPAPLSIQRGVRKLPAGCNLIVDLGHLRPRVERYWEFVLEPLGQATRLAEERWCEELVECLSLAVKRRLVADVPIGVFLSGGIDSTAVASLAARALPDGELRTFSIGFEAASFDESAHAARAAEWLGSRHHSTRFAEAELRTVAARVAAGLDEPMADSSLLPTWLLCAEARQHVTVALGGDGADELFAGYDPFRALALAEQYAKWVPKPVHRGIRMLASRLPTAHHNMSFDFRLKRTLAGLSHPPELWNPIWMAPLGPAELRELFEEEVSPEALYSEAIETWEACAQKDLVAQTLQFFTRLYLQNGILTKVDRASMLHGLEVRSPFLDREVVDFARRLPQSVKLRGGTTKWILKRALAGILPDEILQRAKKGFGIPVGEWFRSGELGFSDTAESPLSRHMDLSFRDRALDRHRRGAADERLYLWSQWLLEAWLAARRD